jgi:putative ABC transport system permease protein
MVSVAATIGVGLMVGSFRQTVVAWLDSSLVADVYVSAPSLVGSRADSALDPTVVDRLRATTGVAGLGTYRGVRVQSTRGVTHLVALGSAPGSRRQFRFLEGVPEAIWPAFETGGAAIVSEPYAYRHRLRAGARLRLRTDRGERDFPVAGVFRDYGSDQGVVMVSRRTYDTLWDDRGVSSVGIFAAPGTDLDTVVGALRQAALGGPELLIRGNRTLREASLEIFDRTFAITGVLRILATLIAFVGILSALMALALERGRELGVLRAQGLTPAQVWGLTTAQTGLMGLLAGLLALPVGIVLALVLIFVINRRSFGWTLEATIAPEVLLQAVGLAVLAALLAGVYPAWRMARTAPAAALREE